MPELPEVETAIRGISPHVIAKTINQVTVRNSQLRWPVPHAIKTQLVGQKISHIERRGKYILMYCDKACVIVHLGMSGSLRITNQRQDVRKHDHVIVSFNNNIQLRYHDPRRFGCWLWSKKPLEHRLLINLGPEPLEDSFNAEYLFAKAQSRTVNIKALIMDSKTVPGVGNIYAQESLFLAGIHPNRQANKISISRYLLLVEHIKQVLKKAIKQGGTTLRDFVNPDGNPGYFQQTLNVYGRAGKPCNHCETLLKLITQQQRSTVYCPQCQR